MEFMRSFATSVTVLARGQVLAEGTVEEVQANPKVQEVYLGTMEGDALEDGADAANTSQNQGA